MSKINLAENHRRGEPGFGRDATRLAKVKKKWRGLVKGPDSPQGETEKDVLTWDILHHFK